MPIGIRVVPVLSSPLVTVFSYEGPPGESPHSSALQLTTVNLTPCSLSRSINRVPVKAAAGVRTPPLHKKEHKYNELNTNNNIPSVLHWSSEITNLSFSIEWPWGYHKRGDYGSPQNADHADCRLQTADCRPCRLCRLSTFFLTLGSLFSVQQFQNT